MATIAAPPWKALFQQHISLMPSPEFTLGTLRRAAHSSSSSSPSYVPHVRTVIYRGMWAELPAHKHSAAPQNPRVYASAMPTFTTDRRMAKVGELGAGQGGSGGGGPVDAVWWVRETKTQWRVSGRAFVLGPDVEECEDVKRALGRGMHALEEAEAEAEGEWSWAREVTAHFGNLSPGMRGSFRNPPPGEVKSAVPAGERRQGEQVEDLLDGVARENFRVVVIWPEEVEMLDLSDALKASRCRYVFDADAGEWRTEELWP
ncbi:MAG: hypothetical protein M1829_003190 [Trizodia sp. TS-e1964]|nr:MAG: hypothetical protein M1829_003190 [Trizodia sp. TS-e1964]